MFHRVKSETAARENEAPIDNNVEQEEVAKAAVNTAQRAQKSSAYSAPEQASFIEEEATQEIQTQEEETVTETEATIEPQTSGFYQPVQKPQAARSTPAYSTRPAGYSSPASNIASASVSAPTAASEASENDRRLTIGRGITMSGEIESCDQLDVEGTVEAALKGASLLNISETGVFYGTVEIEDAVIAGRFEGEIIVNGRLTVEESGVITGSISYKELEIKSGAIIDGRLTPIGAQTADKK